VPQQYKTLQQLPGVLWMLVEATYNRFGNILIKKHKEIKNKEYLKFVFVLQP